MKDIETRGDERKKRVWCRVCSSFEEAEAADIEFYQQMTPAERMSVLQELRESYAKFDAERNGDESGKGFRRHITVLQQQ